MNQSCHLRIILSLAGAHLLLLTAVCVLPVLISGPRAFYHTWVQVAHATLITAQFELLAVFWAIAGCSWSTRTVLFSLGIVTLTMTHAVIMLAMTNYNIPTPDVVWDIVTNDIQMFWASTLVLAVLFAFSRPLWGTLTLETPRVPERLSIFELLRMTTVSALAIAVAAQFMQGMGGVKSFCTHTLIHSGFMASCVWMILAKEHNWIGFVVWIASLAVGIANAPEATVSRHGYGFYAIHVLVYTTWLCATLYAVRGVGFRLQKCVGSTHSPQPEWNLHLDD